MAFQPFTKVRRDRSISSTVVLDFQPPTVTMVLRLQTPVHLRLESLAELASSMRGDTRRSGQYIIRGEQKVLQQGLWAGVPAVPLKLKKPPLAKCTNCSHLQW